MNGLMEGIPVAKRIGEVLRKEIEGLKEEGRTPCLGILRVGERPDDLAYERGAVRKMESLGIACEKTVFSEKVSQEVFLEALKNMNKDEGIDGILMFSPLPNHIDEKVAKKMISPQKDVDGMCMENIAKVFEGNREGFPPCTAEAVMEMLDYYQIDPKGKNVTVIGRSMVIGKPIAMLLLERNGTVTICHTKTEDLSRICRRADILIAAAGKAKMVTEDMVKEGAVVVDVGIHVEEDGSLCGDVDFQNVKKKASYISPVPKGVGSITTSVLAKHVIQAAKTKCL